MPAALKKIVALFATKFFQKKKVVNFFATSGGIPTIIALSGNGECLKSTGRQSSYLQLIIPQTLEFLIKEIIENSKSLKKTYFEG